jgi:hypothetical protein
MPVTVGGGRYCIVYRHRLRWEWSLRKLAGNTCLINSFSILRLSREVGLFLLHGTFETVTAGPGPGRRLDVIVLITIFHVESTCNKMTRCSALSAQTRKSESQPAIEPETASVALGRIYVEFFVQRHCWWQKIKSSVNFS